LCAARWPSAVVVRHEAWRGLGAFGGGEEKGGRKRDSVLCDRNSVTDNWPVGAACKSAVARSRIAASQVQRVLRRFDGFKRHAAARQIAGMTLSVRVLEVDEPTAKAAILGLNRGQRATRELEEAWIVQGLVRDDGSGDPSYVNGAPTSG
jgi:hypothetical protein